MAACRQKTIDETAKNSIRVNYDAYPTRVEQRRQPATNIPARQNELTGETVKRLTPLRLAAQMCREPACKVSQEPLIRRHRLKHAATSAHTRLPQSKRPMAINARVSGHNTRKSAVREGSTRPQATNFRFHRCFCKSVRLCKSIDEAMF